MNIELRIVGILALLCVAFACSSEPPFQPTVPPPLPQGAPHRLPMFHSEWVYDVTAWSGTAFVGAEGTLFVQGQSTLRELTPDGEYLGPWEMEFDGIPVRVAHAEYRYGWYFAHVTDLKTDPKLLVFNKDRELVRWVVTPTIDGGVHFMGLDMDGGGNIYYLEFHEEQVVRVSPSGDVTRWATHGRTPGRDNWPGGLAVARDGRVYVADTLNDRILVFSKDTTLIDEWGERGTGPKQFGWPSDLTMDSYGFIYVVDRLNRRIQKFTGRGTYLGEFSSEVSVPVQNTPIGIAMGDRDLFVIHPGPEIIRRYSFVLDPAR